MLADRLLVHVHAHRQRVSLLLSSLLFVLVTKHPIIHDSLKYESVYRLDACRNWRTKEGFLFPGVPSGNAHSRQIDPRRVESLKEVSVLSLVCRLYSKYVLLGGRVIGQSVALSVCLFVYNYVRLSRTQK